MDAGELKRIAFTVQYDGTAFFGWQLQPTRRTVQGELERVLSRLFDRPARVIGSGRTDRGVHATGQVAAADAPPTWTAATLRRATNALLPEDVWVAHAAEVDPRFHPRFGARARTYVYRIGVAEVSASPFHARWCWPLGRELSISAMEEGARALIGEHSFRAFAKAGQEERGDRCIVSAAGWGEWSDIGLAFHITANRFLHHMVRYLVGTLVDIGLERRPLADLHLLLEGLGGLETSVPAPPPGLYLTEVRYEAGAYPGPDQDSRGDAQRPSTLPPALV
jgi:tRNA pseudouridine38-40 synthase